MGIGGGDYVEFDYCLDCGQIQGTFPVPKHEIEEKSMVEEKSDDGENDSILNCFYR